MVETPPNKETVAVIEVGSSAIRMVVGEVGPKSSLRLLENLQKPVAFGKDVFSTGRLGHEIIRHGIEILADFKTVLETYGVKRMHAIATSAIREASNRDNFIDQVFVRTGIDIEVIEGAEENRLELIAVENALHGRFDFDKKSCLIIEVGTGSTEIILTSRGEVTLTRTLPIGPLRLPEQASIGKTDSAGLQRVIKRRVRSIAEEFSREANLGEIDTFIALGSSMRFLCRQLNDQVQDQAVTIHTKDLTEFLKSLSKLSAEEISDKYALPYSDAETLFASFLLYASFVSETKAEDILVPMVSIRDALLLEMAQLVSGYKRTDLSRQVIHSAKGLARKYKCNEAHATVVAQTALKLFDQLKDAHGLGPRERLLLEIAAVLHDVGLFVSQTSHHKHASYLINASEIFGLRKSDKDIVSNVVRYHRRSPPKATHVGYVSLPRQDRAVVSKLAALLRVADALDASRQQKCRDFTLERENDVYTLWVPETVGDISLERESLTKKGDMFTDVIGSPLALKQGAPAVRT
jgi:exopolyphosphatase / guanosine-5'-triphosphate,3'-diphosphate pyrophosphatase